MTLIDKDEALRIVEEYEVLHDQIAALPARGVGEYTLAPHLQKIVEGAKTAPQWDTQEDRLAPTDAAQAHDEQLGVWADELMADLVLNSLMDLVDHEYDTKVGARREIIAALKQANQARVPQIAPTDAAQAREAHLREAVLQKVAECLAGMTYREVSREARARIKRALDAAITEART